MLCARILVRRCCPLIFLTLFAAAATVFPQDRDPKIDSLAEHLARNLNRSRIMKDRHGAPISFLVLDFADTSGRSTQLGAQLAGEFSSALSGRIQGFSAIDRSRLQGLLAHDRIQPADMQSDFANSWAARALGASLAIVGTIEPLGGEFNLHVRVIDERSKEIADAGEHLDWTEARRGWDTKSAAGVEPANTTRVSRPGVFHPGKNGVGNPECVRCPNPGYTEEARAAKFSGSGIFQIVINPEGSVEDAAPVRGLPFGLTEQALASIRKWQFKPVMGPEGKPVPVEVDVDVTFRIQ